MCKNLQLTAVWAVVIALLMPCVAQAADPPNLDIPMEALGGRISEYEGQIIDRVQYWSRQIADANSVGPIVDARRQLIQDYGKYRETAFRVTYARVTADRLVKLLGAGIDKSDSLRDFKQINAAVVISRMPQTTTKDALAAMITDKANPAIRYLGWVGYRRSRGVLAARQVMIKKAFAGLESAAGAEKSASVVGAIFEMFNIPTLLSAPNDPAVKKLQNDSFKIIEANWNRWCIKTRNGDLEMSRAMARGVKTLGVLAKTVSAQNDGKNKLLQMLCDLMVSSSASWDIAGEGSFLRHDNGEILRSAEKLIISISGKQGAGTPVGTALTKGKQEQRGTKIQLEVFNWIERLEEFGVKQSGVVEKE